MSTIKNDWWKADGRNLSPQHAEYRRFRRIFGKDHVEIHIEAGARANPPIPKEQAIHDGHMLKSRVDRRQQFTPESYVMPYVSAKLAEYDKRKPGLGLARSAKLARTESPRVRELQTARV